MEEFIEKLKEDGKTYDVVFLDRCLIGQLRNAPDITNPISPFDYIEQILNNYFKTLQNYEKYEESLHSDESADL